MSGPLRAVALDLRPLRESKEFRRLWLGQSVSYVGGWIGLVATSYQLYHLTGSTLQVGLLALADLVPLLVLPVLGGLIADSVDRRRMAIAAELAAIVAAAGLVANASVTHPQVWAIYLLAALGTSASALGIPSLRAILPKLVPADQVAAASALQSVYFSFAAVAGPAAAGVIIAGVGLPGAFAIDLATFGASLVAIWALPSLPPDEAERPSLRALREGFAFVRRTRIVFAIFLVDTFAMIFGMPRSLFPALAVHRYGGGATTVGLLYGAPYAGALAAALLSGWIGSVRRQGLVVTVAASGWGAAIAGFGFMRALWPALALLALAGAADTISAVLRSAIVYRETPDELRGRVTGIEYAQVASTPSLGDLEAGTVASLTSLRTSIVSGGILCVAAALAVALALPVLLRYDARRSRQPLEAAA